MLAMVLTDSPYDEPTIGVTIAKIERLDVKDGQYGPYSVAVIGGVTVSAFGANHATLSRMKVGDEVDFKYERKGQYDRITSINVVTGGSFPSGASSGNSVPASLRLRGDEIPLSMKVAWAKDLIIGNAAGNAKDAVALVEDIVKEFKDVNDPLVSTGIK